MVAAFVDTGFSTEPGPAGWAVPAGGPAAVPGGPAAVPAAGRAAGPAGDPATVHRRPTGPSAEVLGRRRAVAGGLLATALLGLFLLLQALFGRSGGGPLTSVGLPAAAQAAAPRVWVVQPGDTLWTIALASGARGDIRPFVARLSAETHGQPLQPGERIVIPPAQ